LTAAERLIARELLAHQSGEPRDENLEEVARLLGVKMVTVDDRRTRMPREAPPPAEKTPQEYEKQYSDELLELHAVRLGLKLR